MSVRPVLRGVLTTAVTTVVVLALALATTTTGAPLKPTHQAFKDQTRSRLQALEATVAEQRGLIAELELRIAALEPAATPEPTAAPDPTPAPVAINISGIVVEEVGQDYAVVSWSVDPPSQGWVEYGLTEEYGSETRHESRLLGFHRQRVSGLEPGTTYHFRVWAHVPDQEPVASEGLST